MHEHFPPASLTTYLVLLKLHLEKCTNNFGLQMAVYVIHNEFSPSHYTDLPFEVESGFIHSALNHIFQDFFR